MTNCHMLHHLAHIGFEELIIPDYNRRINNNFGNNVTLYSTNLLQSQYFQVIRFLPPQSNNKFVLYSVTLFPKLLFTIRL